jgi:hypothetical protein
MKDQLTPRNGSELLRFTKRPGRQIDLSDIPEIRQFPSDAAIGKCYSRTNYWEVARSAIVSEDGIRESVWRFARSADMRWQTSSNAFGASTVRVLDHPDRSHLRG